MTLINLVFWLLTLVTVGSACVVAFSRNLIRSVFALFFTLGGIAGYFVLLGADFLGVVQLILYVGGILVLLIFGIFLTERTEEEGPIRNAYTHPVPALIISAAVLFLVVSAVGLHSTPPPEYAAGQSQDAGSYIHGWDRTHASPVTYHGRKDDPSNTAVGIVEKRNTTLILGQAFLTDYIVAFELASIVLLIGLIGAASIARKEVRA